MIFGLVRTKAVAARPNRLFKLLLPIFIGFLVSVLGQSSVPPAANALYFGSGYNAAVAGNAGGGNQNGVNACATDMVAVGVGLTVNGSSPGFGVYCRAIGPDGQLVAQDQSSAANTTAVGGGSYKVFCPAGKVVTGISFIIWSNVAIRCATPPSLSDNSALIWYAATTSTPASTNCSANGIVAGFFTRTGAWTDAIGAYCLPYSLNTVSYNVNGGSGTAPTSQTQTAPAQTLTVSSSYTGTRAGFHISGWNTLANGLGTDYANGSSIRPIGATTLYAKWTSTITYNGNTNSGGTVPDPTIAVSSAAVTKLANNSGNLVKTGFTFAGWNTAANGSGTSYSGYGYATPLLRYVASNYDTSTKVWANTGSAGSAYNISSANMGSGAGITKVSTTAGVGGSSNSFTTLKGGTTSIIEFPNAAMNNYTLCHVARYAGAAKQRIFTHSSVNWLSGYLSGQSGYYYGVGNNGTVGLQTGDTNWHLICDYNLNFRNNGTAGAAAGRTSLPANIGVATWSTQTSDWEIAEVLFYDVALGTSQIQQIEESLASTYGLSGYTSTNGTYASTGDITLYAQWNSTITYDGNGQTSASSTVPAPTIAKGTAGNTTLASQGTLLKTGATFSGWNTAADGTGTRYAAGLATYASTGSRTLYAQWTVPTGTPTLDTASDLGTSNTDKITSDNTPTINIGTLVSGAVITLTATPASGTAVRCSFTASSTTGSCTFPTLPDGTYSITATQTYNGATSVASTALAGIVIDATRPTVTLSATVGAGTNVVSGANDTIARNTAINTYTIKATFSESVSGLLMSEITKDAASTGWSIGSTLTGSGTSYTFSATNSGVVVNTEGKLLLRVLEGVAVDVAGNTNTATTSDFVINSVARVDFWDCGPLGQYCTGGTGSASLTQATSGASITLPGANTLYKTGYSFTGWGETQTAVSILTGSYTPSTRIILFPQWTPNVYVVTYNANGGNGAPTTASQNFTYGSTALSPSAKGTLARTGYTFAGWSTTAVASGTIYSNSSDSIAGTTTTYTPTSSITLYAKWTANTYAVTFDANNGTGTQMTNLSITAGTAISLTANSYSRTGYTFGGWNTLANGTGTSYANSASVTLFANTTIYAQWVPVKPGVPSVSISGSAGNTQITVSVTAATLSSTSGPATTYTVTSSPGALTCTITSPATTCTFTGLTNGQAYTFTGVATNTTGSSNTSAASSSATPAPYVVTYALNGGTLSTTTANYNLGTPLTLPLPTKTGYTFAGWNNPSSTLVGIDGGSYSPSASITLTAQWSAITYTVTYNGNGSDGGTVVSAGSFAFGNSYSIADKGTMTKSGHTFAGWTTTANGSGTVYANTANSIASSTATYSAAANLNLYAKWTPQVYVITYNANGASGSPSRATDSFTFGSTPITLPDKTGLTYGGYTFGGWSETSTGLAVVNPYSPTQSRTLYAVWSGVQYSVTYDVNGGSGSVADATYTTGSTGLTLNNGSGLTRTGYTFGGWKNLAGTTVSGSPYSPTDNVTLYAIWTPVSVAIAFNAGTIAGSAPTVTLPSNTNAQYSALYALPAALATVTDGGNPAASYAFAGWAFNGNIYQAGSTYRMTTISPTFTAQWQKILAVAYVLNGGSLASGDQLYDTDCTFEPVGHQCGLNNLVITLNKAPSRAGFSFAGWSSQGTPSTLIPAETSYTLDDSNYIFYANWTANSYTITFAAGAGSNGNAPAITDSYGATVQLAASTGYSVSGSKFTGWLIGSTTYAAGALYVMGTDASPITATAQFANNTFKVFYNTNGATAGATPAATAAVQGASINFDGATGFSRPGFTFEGWSDGTDIRAAGYATTMGATNTTVIAQWKIAIPQAPTISSVTGSDGGATITVAAAGSGGAPSSYLVTASPGGATCTVYAPATSCSISPLTNGTSYTFNATATNSTGTSSGTTSSAVTPAGKPDAPTGVNAVSGNGSATVSFTAPTNTGGPAIASYTVTASPGGASCTVNAPATSCAVSGLTNGTAYTFAVTANNGLFTSSASTASSSVVPATVPDAPTSVTATSSTSGSATVAFTAPVNNGGSAITGYRITSSPAGATCVVGANATTYTCTGLTDGTAYTFGVVAINNVGNSVSATSSSVTTQGAASAPTTISATAGDGKATVTFSGAVANGSTITGYTVQAYDNTGNAVTGVTCTVTSSATSGSCEVTGLTNGSSYTFKAVTNSTANSTAVSSAPSIATTGITPAKAPDAPTGVQVTAGTGKVTVSWTAPSSNGSSITSYTVQAYDVAGNAVSGATCTATAPATTCDVSTNLTAGTNYTFKVTATSAAGTSSASSASSSVAVNAAPSVPRNVVATAGNGSVAVTWDAPSDTRGSALSGYTTTAYTSGNNVAGTCTSTVIAEACTVSGLTNGTAYTFKVVAINGIGTSLESTASNSAIPSTVPNAPTAVSAAVGDAEATISFTAPANNGGSSVTSYTVTASNGATINGSTSPLTISGLTNGTAYTFTVKATNKNGDSVASVASASVTPIGSSIPTLANGAQPTGNPYVGSTLTSAVTFNGAPTPTQTYQWQVCTSSTDLSTCTNISGATSASYVPTIIDEGKYIVVVATATNRVGTAVETSTPTLVINPEIAFSAPSPVPGATAGTAYVLSAAAAGGVGTFTYTVVNGALPSGVTLDPATGQIAGTPTTAGTNTFTVRAADSNGVYKDVVITIVVAAASTPAPTCDADCQAAKEAAATKAAADKAAADALAKAAADKAAADAAAAAKAAANTAANTASTKAAADAAAAAAAAKAAIDKAAAAAVAQAAADAAAKAATAQAKAAADAQATAAKAAADAAAALKNSTATAAAKAAATASANTAAAQAAAAVKAAARAAQQAAQAKTTAANATKQVDIAINSLTSKTAASQASAQANAIAAAAKAAADAAAKEAADAAATAKATATAAQKAASDTAARIATEQKQAATVAALAKVAADAAAKATADKIAAEALATKAAQDLAKVLADKATLAEQAAKTTDEAARAEIQKKIEEVTTKVEEVQKSVEAATNKAEAAATVQEAAKQNAEAATQEAQTQAAEAVAVKAESVAKTAAATKAVAAASVAAKVATAAKAAAAKIPSKAVITTKPSTSTSKNSATATVTGLKPGQKVKVTVNVKDK